MLNNVTIMGRITREIELKQTPNGVAYTKFSIAVEQNMVNKSTGKREVDFVDMMAWSKTAELIEKYFPKGSMLLADGTLRVESWKDKDTGKTRSRTYVLVEQVYFTGTKQDSQKKAGAEPPKQSAPTQNNSGISLNDFEEFGTDDDDLPY